MLVEIFQVVLSYQKTTFRGILYFLCRLYNLMGCLFQCVVTNFCHGDCKLMFHVIRGRENCHLGLFDLGIFQVRLDVRSLEKLESLPISCLCLCVMRVLIVQVRFYNFQG